MTKRITHLIDPNGGAEHAFCGIAFDAFASGDFDSDDEFVQPPTQRTITCPECAQAVAEIRSAIKGVKFRPTHSP